ncbi:DNA mismatch repair protein MutS [Spirochaeta dissipatitropha]
MSADTPMMQQYRHIKDKQRDAILFFRLGDFYEMFFQDAKEASGILGLTLTQRNGIPMCGIPFHAADSYIPRLLKAGKKIAICEQTEPPSAGKKIVDRKVIEVISPGTIVEGNFLDSRRDNYLLSVCRTKSDLCLAWLDVSTGRFEIHSYPWQQAVSGLQREIARLSPKELIVQESLYESELGSVLGSSRNRTINRYPDWVFSQQESWRRLTEYFSTVHLRGFGIEKDEPALAAAGPLLDYAVENVGAKLGHLSGIQKVQDSDYVPLDEATQKNLELVENLEDGGTEFTVFQVLDFTQTAMGARTLSRWLLQPLRKLETIIERQGTVGLLYHHQIELNEIRSIIASARDLERLAAKIGTGRSNPREYESIGASLNVVIELHRYVEANPALNDVFLLGAEEKQAAQDLSRLLNEAISDNPPLSPLEGGIIRDGYDEKVDSLRNLHRNSDAVLQQYVQQLQSDTGLSTLKVKYNRVLGYFLELGKSKRDQIPDYFIPRQSLTQCDRFTTKTLNEIETELNDAQQNLIDRELEVFQQIRTDVESRIAEILRIAGKLGELDSLQSLAQAATIHGYVKPVLDTTRRLEIEKGRHPVVEQFMPGGDFIPNSVDLSTRSFSLITGPNMAGKSTYLRQTALIVLLSQIGSFVPAESAHIGIADKIYCRVGARDNLARGESTFLVEMSETAHILRTSGPNSLIIMDEVGRGTSSTDGQAIAHAVCEYILDTLDSRTLFATHYHQLSQIEHENFQNQSLAVLENGRDIVFLREIQQGPSSHSYGIQAARLAGVPEQIIAHAEKILELIEPEQEIALPQNKPVSSVQKSPQLFSVETEIADILRNTDPDSLSPKLALELIYTLKEQLN